MEFTAEQIADFLDGTVDGNPQVTVSNISKIEEGNPGTITFLANPAYTKYIYNTRASIVIVNRNFIPEHSIETTLIRVDDSYQAFAKLLQMVSSSMQKEKKGISGTAVVPDSVIFEHKESVWIAEYVVLGENVKIGSGVRIYPHTFVDDHCEIGRDTIIYSGVKLYNNTVVGNSCVIHSGSVLGADGFGFAPKPDGSYEKIPQLGNVILEDQVEIGANTTIDRATFSSTVIRAGTKLDNLIQIAHNCEIGRNTVIASQAGVSGSSRIGNNCMIGGQAGLSGHIAIGNNVSIAAQSGIANNIEDNSQVMGSPAFDASKYKRAFILFKNIEEVHRRLIQLEKKSSE